MSLANGDTAIRAPALGSETGRATPRSQARENRSKARILAVATQGAKGNDEARLRALLSDWPTDFFPFERSTKLRSCWGLLSAIRRQRPDLVVMEGTGIGGGLPLLLARLLFRVPYVVSSGDAVAPFVASKMPWLRPTFSLYERLLCRFSAAFVGWTPYLVGRALTFGAPRGLTAAGWAPFPRTPQQLAEGRARVRARLEIPEDALVIGIVGSLAWSSRVGYCYGYELVRAVERVGRSDVRVLIVGDGDGRPRLEQLAGGELGRRVLIPGPVPRDEVPDYMAAMDLASLPQSVDQVGSFRYTTKLSEYLAAGLPIVTGQIPLAYDLDGGWLWRLPGSAPWSDEYSGALARLLDEIEPGELAAKRSAVPGELPEFDRALQVRRVSSLIADLLATGDSQPERAARSDAVG